MQSLNNATIGLAGMVGFDRVAALARDAGIKSARGTPAVAIGAYDATPLDMAGAYTSFANGGLHIDPWMVASIRTLHGRRHHRLLTHLQAGSGPARGLSDHQPDAERDQRRHRLRGPPARLPGSGRGQDRHQPRCMVCRLYQSNLLCIVWVGNDDYSNVQLEGAHAAAPIWAEFMKKAVLLPQYSDTNQFAMPEGVEIASIDRATNLLSDESCPGGYNVAFLAGTAPLETCDHSTDHRNLLQKLFGQGKPDSN